MLFLPKCEEKKLAEQTHIYIYNIYDKTSSGRAKRRYSQQLKLNSNWQDTLG